MSKDKLISRSYFIKRLIDLCLRSGLSGFPKNNRDQYILFKSAVLIIGKAGIYTETILPCGAV